MNERVLRVGRRVAIAVIGGVVVVAGILLALPLVPGPGIPLVLVGMGILSLEFERPRALLVRLRGLAAKLKRRFDERRSRTPDGH
jgi:hypothetical protein